MAASVKSRCISPNFTALSERMLNVCLLSIDTSISKPSLTWRYSIESRASLRVIVESVEFVLAETAALLVAKRRGDFVLLQPGSDAGQVVLVDERQTVSLEKAAEVDSDDSKELPSGTVFIRTARVPLLR